MAWKKRRLQKSSFRRKGKARVKGKKYRLYRRRFRRLSIKTFPKGFLIGFLVALVVFVLYWVWLWVSAHVVQSIAIGLLVVVLCSWLVWRRYVPLRRRIYKVIDLFAPVKDKDVSTLIGLIEGIKVQDVRSEEDFEKQLFQRLDARGYKVERQVRYGPNNIVDLVVDGRIGVELKVADRAKNVRDLIGQVTVYKKHLKKIIVGILDCDAVQESDLQEYISLIKKIDKKNIRVFVVKGEVRRPKKKQEYIMVKQVSS